MAVLYIVAWVLQVLIMIGAPIVIAFWFGRRYRVKLAPFLLGAGIFLVFQMLTRVPLVQILSAVLAPTLAESALLQVLYLAALAFTAGLFESVGRWVGYRFLFRSLEYRWKNGVAYGLGHAGMESAGLIGLTQAINLAVTLVVLLVGEQALSGILPPEALGPLANIPEQLRGLPWYLPLWGALERLLTLPFHTAMSLIVMQVFVRKQGYWLWVAVGLHALVDFTAPAMLNLLHLPIWATELYIALWAAAALWLILRWKDAPEAGGGNALEAQPIT